MGLWDAINKWLEAPVLTLKFETEEEEITSNQYLNRILNKYKLDEEQIEPIKEKRNEIELYLKEQYGSNITNFYYSGSYAKGTAIKLNYDLDLCVYFKRSSFSTLREMFNDLSSCLSDVYTTRKQNVSIGIKDDDDDNDDDDNYIDVIPARRINDDTTDVNLYVSETDNRILTNIPIHKQYVSDSKCRSIIKIM